ncbi:MAG: SPOR domain-containing protein [Methylophaga sp.]|nr:SPOR domain-containing protein [Methylophaga sp.]
MTPIQQQRLIGAGLLVLLVAVLAYVVLSKVGQHQTEQNLVLPEPIEFSSVIEPIAGDGAEAVQNSGEAMVDADLQQTTTAEDRVIAGYDIETPHAASDPAQPAEPLVAETTNNKPVVTTETPPPQPMQRSTAQAQTIAPEAASKNTDTPTVVAEPNAGTVATGERWLIQLGSFSVQKNAQSLKAEAEKLGYKPYIENSQTGAGPIYRVRLPAMATRTQADDTAARIEKQLKIKTQVSQQ